MSAKNPKVDFNVVLKDIDGKDMTASVGFDELTESLVQVGVSAERVNTALKALTPFIGSGERKTEPLRAHRVVANALQSTGGRETPISGADMVKRMRLAFKCMDSKQPVEITADEQALILSSVEKAFSGSALIYFRMSELFDAATAAANTAPVSEPVSKE